MHEWYIGKDRVKSKIEIDPATQMDAGKAVAIEFVYLSIFLGDAQKKKIQINLIFPLQAFTNVQPTTCMQLIGDPSKLTLPLCLIKALPSRCVTDKPPKNGNCDN